MSRLCAWQSAVVSSVEVVLSPGIAGIYWAFALNKGYTHLHMGHLSTICSSCGRHHCYSLLQEEGSRSFGLKYGPKASKLWSWVLKQDSFQLWAWELFCPVWRPVLAVGRVSQCDFTQINRGKKKKTHTSVLFWGHISQTHLSPHKLALWAPGLIKAQEILGWPDV